MAAVRILFYAVNGLGLGHVTRLLAIARQIRFQRPDAQCIFLTSSEAEEVIFREGFPAFKVPSRTSRVLANLEPARYARTVQTVTWSLISSFDPHILVVDTFPAGTLQELLPVLRWNLTKVFVFREQQETYAQDPYLQKTLSFYQTVLIPHLPHEYSAPVPEGVQTHWLGPVLLRERGDVLSRCEARLQLGLSPSLEVPYVLITFGGGGDGEGQRLSTQCGALTTSFPNVQFVFAPGPLWPPSVALPKIRLIHHYPLVSCLSAFNAALSAVGYNTAQELLHHGVPTVFLPLAKGIDDQYARAQRIAAAQAGLVLDKPSDEELVAAMKQILNPQYAESLSKQAQAFVPAGGAAEAARRILALDEIVQNPSSH